MKRILKYNFDALYTFYLLNFVTNGKLQQAIETIAAAVLQYFCKQGSNRVLKKQSSFSVSEVKAIKSISKYPFVSNSLMQAS